MWSEIENKGKSKEKIRFGKGLPKWLSHRSTEVYRNSDPAEVPNRTEDFGRPLMNVNLPNYFSGIESLSEMLEILQLISYNLNMMWKVEDLLNVRAKENLLSQR